MKRTLILMTALLVSGCTFQLGKASMPYPPGATDQDKQAIRDKLQADIAECKDWTKNQVDGAWFGQFLLGATVVGLPAGYEWEKNRKRDLYADCMTQRGYTVTKATD